MEDITQNVTNSFFGGIKTYLAEHGFKLIMVVFVLVVGMYFISFLAKKQRRITRKYAKNPTLPLFCGSIIEWILRGILILASASFLGINSLSLTALLGTIGLAIGLAMKNTLSSFVGGVLILILKPFKVGDTIELHNGVLGTVELIQIFATRITTLDNKRIVVPNVLLTSNIIINYSGETKRRVDLEIGISYDSDLLLAKSIISDIFNTNPKILKEPEPIVGVKELADSAVVLLVRPWCDTADVLSVHMEVTEAIKLRFDAEGVKIPFPQRNVHLFLNKGDGTTNP